MAHGTSCSSLDSVFIGDIVVFVSFLVFVLSILVCVRVH